MTFTKWAALLLAATLSIAAAPRAGNWNAAVAVTSAGGHVMGNPDAPLKLAEYVSYTCSHCADFQREADAPLLIYFVRPGKVSIEVRHLVRDPIDLTVAMLANCGEPAKFFRNHNAFLKGQARWMARLDSASEGERRRWTSGDAAARRRAIASAFGFYAIMEGLGYGRPAADRCLADEAMARRLAAQTREAASIGVAGTPSFLLNGELLAGTHDWRSLEAQLRARL